MTATPLQLFDCGDGLVGLYNCNNDFLVSSLPKPIFLYFGKGHLFTGQFKDGEVGGRGRRRKRSLQRRSLTEERLARKNFSLKSVT